MDIGMPWFDNDTKTDLETKVHRAADYYHNKYGRTPNICFVNPSTSGIDTYKNNGIELRTTLNNFWIGARDT